MGKMVPSIGWFWSKIKRLDDSPHPF